MYYLSWQKVDLEKVKELKQMDNNSSKEGLVPIILGTAGHRDLRD